MHIGKKSTGFLSILLLLCGYFARAESAPQNDKKINRSILLVTMDTVRADMLGCYGNPSFNSPVLDMFSRQTTLWTRIFTDVPLTLPSHVSILSMTSAQTHSVINNGMIATPQSSWVPLRLKKLGYTTAAVVSGFPLSHKFGIQKAFDFYDDRMERKVKGYPPERDAEEATDAAITFLETGATPLFLWVHYYDPHAPYEPPSPYAELFKNRYEGECISMTHHIGRLIGKWTQSQGSDASIVILSDHGEALGSHGESTHGVFLYQETARLVCMTAVGGLIAQPRLNEASLPASQLWSQFSEFLFNERIVPSDPGIIQTIFPFDRYRWSALKGMIKKEWKYIRAPKKELYNLDTDPGEIRNLASENEVMVTALETEISGIENRIPLSVDRGVDTETRQQLESLGYTMSGIYETDEKTLPDPKDKAQVLIPLENALEMVRNNDYLNAKSLLEKVLGIDPGNPVANNNMGIVLLQEEKPSEALGYLERALSTRPDDCQIMLNQALAYRKTGQLSRAESILREIIRKDSLFGAAHLNLAVVLFLSDRFPECLESLNFAISIDPEIANNPTVHELKREMKARGIRGIDK